MLEENGVNVSAIQTLKRNASDMSGPEVAAVAQSIAGPNAGAPVSTGAPENVPAADLGNEAVPDDADHGNQTAGDAGGVPSGDSSDESSEDSGPTDDRDSNGTDSEERRNNNSDR